MIRTNFVAADTIPVRYMVGTGGVFLTTVLTGAKYNEKIAIKLSRYGNCHSREQDFSHYIHPSHGLGPIHDDDIKMNALNSMTFAFGEPPYFVHTHITDLKKTLSQFPKVLTISYTIDDYETLSDVIIYKYTQDTAMKSHDLDKSMEFWTKIMIKYHSHFNEEAEGNTNIPFNLMLNGDIEEFVSVLSNVSGYPRENFDREFINEWRRKTLELTPRAKPPFIEFLKKYQINEAGTRPVEVSRNGNGYAGSRSTKSWRDLQKNAFIDGDKLEFAQDQLLIDLVNSAKPSTIFAQGDVEYFRKFFNFDSNDVLHDMSITIINSDASLRTIANRIERAVTNTRPGGILYFAINKYFIIHDGSVNVKTLPEGYDESIISWVSSLVGGEMLAFGFNANDDGRYFNFVHPTTYMVFKK